MNRRIVFIISLLLALLLNSIAGIVMIYDEKNRIKHYLKMPEPVVIQLIPEESLPTLPNMQEILDEAEAIEEVERAEKSPSQEVEENSQELTPEESLKEEAAKEEASQKEDEKQAEKASDEEKPHKAASYKQNISKGGDLLKESILPPREEGEYRRTVTTENDPYQKLVEDAIELLGDTPFLDKEWKEVPEGEETPTYYSPEFMDLLKKYNPQEPINKKEIENDEPAAPIEAEESDVDQFGNPKPVTLIVNKITPPIDIAEIEEIAKRKEAEKNRIHNTNIINAAGSQIRRKEYNVALTSTKCYDNYIKGSNRRYTATVMILEDPIRTGIYHSTGNLELDSCIMEMTNLFIEIPAEMERIRRNAPRLGNGKNGYLLNATF